MPPLYSFNPSNLFYMQALSSNNPIVMHAPISFESHEYKMQRHMNTLFKINIQKNAEKGKIKVFTYHNAMICIRTLA